MITIRRKNAENINLEIYKNITHFEIVYKSDGGRFIYSQNKGNLEFLIRQLEKENKLFILYTSVAKTSVQEKMMFPIKDIGMVVFDNTFSKVLDEELEYLADLFSEYYDTNKTFTLENCFYKFLGETMQSHFTDDQLNMVVFKNDGTIINRHINKGDYQSNKKIWNSKAGYNLIDNKEKTSLAVIPISEKQRYKKPGNDYENLEIDVLDPIGRPITDPELVKIGNRFKTFVKSCHDTMKMTDILHEFKKLNLSNRDIDIKVHFTSHDSCDLVMDDMPTDIVKHKKNYTSIKQIIEDYETGECLIPTDFENFTKEQIRGIINIYPLLFAELIQDGWSVLSDDQINQLEEMTSEEEYQATKKETYFDESTGVPITLCICYDCEGEDFEEEMTEYIIEGKECYFCKDCIKNTTEQQIMVQGEAF